MSQDYNTVYNEMDEGVNTISNTVKNINQSINDCNNIIKGVFDDSTFSGPMADYCHGGWSDLSEMTLTTNSTLNSSASVLNQNNQAYKDSDKSVEDKVSGV